MKKIGVTAILICSIVTITIVNNNKNPDNGIDVQTLPQTANISDREVGNNTTLLPTEDSDTSKFFPIDKATFDRNKKIAHQKLMNRMQANKSEILEYVKRYREFRKWNRPLAIKKALETDWEGDTSDIEMLDPSTGEIIALVEANASAAILVEADDIKPGGSFWDGNGTELTGSGMTIGVWDGGRVNKYHNQFFVGSDDGQTRVTYMDDDVNFRSSHATHVAGTIGGDGVGGSTGVISSSAQGMATEVNIHTYHKAKLFTEIPSAMANDGLVISNHSTSNPRGLYTSSGQWTSKAPYPYPEDHGFRNYDAACYWLDDAIHTSKSAVFVASGNSQLHSTEEDAVTGGDIRYRDINGDWQIVDYADFPVNTQRGNEGTIPSYANAKNVFTVGAAQDFQNVVAYFSNKGPSGAGGSIKPDAIADGWNLLSAYTPYVGGKYDFNQANSNYYTGSISGTSMATPNTTGVATLLMEYYIGLNGAYPTDPGAFLRGLLKHTTQDAFADGESPTFTDGYGLISAKNGAEVIKRDFNSETGARIAENTLQEGEQHVYKVTSTGGERVMVSICWTDLPATPSTGNINDYDAQATGNNDPGGDEINQGNSDLEDFAKRYEVIDNWLQPRIVNDLTLRGNRLSNNAISYPYVLDPYNPDAAATQEDNFRDPYELISIANPGAAVKYTFTVSHKKTITGGNQPYTIIFSGVTQDFEAFAVTEFKGYPTQDITFTDTDFEDDMGTPLTITSVGTGADYSVSGNTITIDGPAAGGWLTVPITFAGGNTINANVQVLPVNIAPSFVVPGGSDINLTEDSDEINVEGWANTISNGNPGSNQTVEFQIAGIDPNFYTVPPTISNKGNLYFVINDANYSGTDALQVTLVDNGETGGPHQNTSSVFNLNIVVAPVNDVPTFTGGGDVQQPPVIGDYTIAGWATNIDDGDPEPETNQALTFNITGNTNPGLFSAGPAIADATTGDLTFSLTGTEGIATITINLGDDGGANSPDYVFTIAVGTSFLVINEIGAYSAGGSCDFVDCTEVDASGEGTFGVSSDEFIELVNFGDESFDLTDWSIEVTGATEYTFGNIMLAPNQAVVIFGTSAVPDANIYADENIIALVAPSQGGSGLGLSNGGDVVKIIDDSATEYTSITYGSQTRSISSTRSPDLTGAFADANHPTISNSPWQRRTIIDEIGPVYSNDNDAQISPGRRTDGSSFLHEAPTFSIPAPIVYAKPNSGSRTMENFIQNMDDGDIELDQSFIQFNVVDNDNPTLFVVQPTITIDGTLTFKVANEVTGTATVTVSLQDDGSSVSPNVNISAGQQFTITITNTAMVINEVMAWPAGSESSCPGCPIIDTNGDGNFSYARNEFIELVNIGDQDFTLDGWQIFVDNVLEYAFPALTLNPNQSTVIYGTSAVPDMSLFNNVAVDVATSQNEPGLGLVNTGAIIELREDDGITVHTSLLYGTQDRSISWSRVPDLSGGFTSHPTNNGAWLNDDGSDGNISPGTGIDGTSFQSNDPPSFHYGGSVFVFENTGEHVIENWATNITDGDPELSESITFEISTLPNSLFSTQPTLSTSTGNLTFTLAANQTGTAVLDVLLRDAADNTSTTEELRITVVPESDGATLMFNEFMTWPAGGSDYANGPIINSNGQSSAEHRYDEFIEMINFGNTVLSISGWQITDDEAGNTVLHTFPGSTELNPGQSIVVFGNGGNPPQIADFGGAIVQESSEGMDMGLNNSGDLGIYIINEGTVIDKFQYKGYNDLQENGTPHNIRATSFSRSPDVTGAYTHHPDNSSLLNPDNNNAPSNISPGRKIGGENFPNGKLASGNANWTMFWDNTNLYISIADADLSQGAVVYIDTDPLPIAQGGAKGGNASSGNLAGVQYDNITMNPAFRANYVLYFDATTRNQRAANGAGNWTDNSNTDLVYTDNGTVRSITIPWANMGGEPSSFAWSGYVGYENGGDKNVYGALPSGNPDELSDANPIDMDANLYFVIENTNGFQDPFANNCYVSTGDDNLGVMDVYNMTIASSHTVTMTDDWNISGSLLIANNGTLTGTNTITLENGSWDNNSGGDFTGTGTVTFSGSTPATISGATSFNNLQINNSGGVTLNDPTTVTGELQLIEGVINTDGINLLTLNAGATISALSSDSYVDGPMKKIGDDAFIFPVGDQGTFAPIGIQDLQGTVLPSDEFIAEYTKAAYIDIANITTELGVFEEVSDKEHWDLERALGDAEANVSLYFGDMASSGIDTPDELLVAHFTGGQWVQHGGIYSAGETSTSGTITSGTIFTGFSPISFGGGSSNQNLPITLTSFTGVFRNKTVALTWTTASEERSSHYTVQRSNNGQKFEDIGSLQSSNSSNGDVYTFIDLHPLLGTSYYRLKSVDFDNNFELSEMIAITTKYAGKTTVYPNPIEKGQRKLTLQFDYAINITPQTKVMLYDFHGRKVFETEIGQDIENGKIEVTIPDNILSGIYIIKFNVESISPIKIQVIR